MLQRTIATVKPKLSVTIISGADSKKSLDKETTLELHRGSRRTLVAAVLAISQTAVAGILHLFKSGRFL